MSTIVCLSGDAALWLSFTKGVLVDAFKETAELSPDEPYKRCRWFSRKAELVHLLIDCEHAEIEAHPLVRDSLVAWRHRFDKAALVRTLTTRFPLAFVKATSNRDGVDAALVHHVNLPDAQLNWLKRVESDGIVFRSVSTVADTLATQTGKSVVSQVLMVREKQNNTVAYSGVTNSGVSSSAASGLGRVPMPCSGESSLVVSVAPEFVRHTYCRNGQALFTRAVHINDSTSQSEQFRQTLDHLFSSELVDRAVSVNVVGASEHFCKALGEIELVSGVSSVDLRTTQRVSEFDAIEKNDIGLVTAGQILAQSNTLNGRGFSKANFYTRNYEQLRARHSRVKQGVAALGLVLISTGFTLLSEWQHTQKLDQHRMRQAELKTAIELYQQEALRLTPDAFTLSSALLDKVALESAAGLNPAIVLTTLAESLTQYKSLSLQEVSWTVIDTANPASGTEFPVTSTQTIASRSRAGQEAGIPSVTKVRLQGKIVQGESLVVQQSAFNSFIDHLKKQYEISNLAVINNPLTEFDGFSPMGANNLEDWPSFEIQFDLNRVLDHEA